jgi:hypothetical protein
MRLQWRSGEPIRGRAFITGTVRAERPDVNVFTERGGADVHVGWGSDAVAAFRVSVAAIEVDPPETPGAV